MAALSRQVVLGDALKILGVKRTQQGRRRIMNRAQLPFAVILTIVLGLALLIGVPDDTVPWILAAWAFTIVPTVVAYFVPWEYFPEQTGIALGAIDLITTAVVSAALIGLYPTIGAIQLVPVLILAFSFGLAGMATAIVGSIFISLLPVLVYGTEPTSAYGALRMLLVPFVVAIIALATQAGSRLLQAVQRRVEEQQTITMTVLDALDVGTAYVRKNGDIGFTNKAFDALVKESAVDPSTRAGTNVFAEDRVTRVPAEDQMMAQAARGEYFDSRMYVIGESSVLVSARPVVTAEGKKIGSAFVSKDITELADSLRVREEFLSVVSHELRTPLTSIMGYLEVLEDELDNEDAQVYIDAMARNSRKLLARIDDLLHVADPNRTLAYSEVDVPTLVASCVEDFRLRGASVTLTSPNSFTATVDEARIRQVVDNLLSNAVKYSTGEVRASVSVAGPEFVISVSDDGFGIAEHELKHVFDRFYRTESVRDAVIQGTGLGLSIVQDIVEEHGGTITATSRLGVGSTFTVTLPLRVAASIKA